MTVQFGGEQPGIERLLGGLPAVSGLTQREGRWQFLTGDSLAALRLLATLPVTDVAIKPPSLEDVFLQYYRPEDAAHSERAQ